MKAWEASSTAECPPSTTRGLVARFPSTREGWVSDKFMSLKYGVAARTDIERLHKNTLDQFCKKMQEPSRGFLCPVGWKSTVFYSLDLTSNR